MIVGEINEGCAGGNDEGCAKTCQLHQERDTDLQVVSMVSLMKALKPGTWMELPLTKPLRRCSAASLGPQFSSVSLPSKVLKNLLVSTWTSCGVSSWREAAVPRSELVPGPTIRPWALVLCPCGRWVSGSAFALGLNASSEGSPEQGNLKKFRLD